MDYFAKLVLFCYINIDLVNLLAPEEAERHRRLQDVQINNRIVFLKTTTTNY